MSEDVLIVGGGPVGLVNALGLAKRGVNVTVIEAADGIVNSPRAMGYHPPVLDVLDVMGLFDDMKAEGFLGYDRAWRILATGEVISWDYGALTGSLERPYSLVLGQNKLAGVVLKHPQRYPNAQVHWGVTFQGLAQDDTGVTVKTTSAEGPREYRASWVIGADGGRSGVRKALSLNFEGVTWPRRFVATNVYFDFDKYGWHSSNYVVDPKLGAVIAKVQSDGMWRVTYSEDATLPMETVGERIPDYYRQVFPGSEPYEMTLYSGYNMHQRAAEKFRLGRVVLAGDAAHVTNPTSGYGLVGGLYDSFVLSEALAAVVNGEIGEEVLDRYAEARRKVFLEVTSPVSSESMRMVFYSDDPDRLERELDQLRRVKAQPQAVAGALNAASKLETPSLITGRTAAQTLSALRTAA